MIEEKEFDKEKRKLKEVCKIIDGHIKRLTEELKKTDELYQDLYDSIAENYATLDDTEIGSSRALLNQFGENYNGTLDYRQHLILQSASPYFGKFVTDEDKKNQYLVGIGNVFDKNNEYPIVFDWRAPICALYYDNELGKTFVEIDGESCQYNILEKRSYKIKNRELLNIFETTSATSDEMLENILTENTTNKMKNIVSSIQTEQNSIIRNDKAETILVQGVAGSGKTSIALHRVAYLLYKYRETLKSQDFCLISPNNIFSDYVSNVLPELGEENVLELSFDEMAKEEFKKFNLLPENRESMIEDVMNNKIRRDEVLIKSTFEFYDDLQVFLSKYLDAGFKPSDINFGGQKIKKETLAFLYNEKYHVQIPSQRLLWINDYIMEKWNLPNITSGRIKKMLFNMLKNNKIESIYEQFLNSIGLKYEKINRNIRCEDVAPLLIVIDYLLGLEPNQKVKYLLIDEMQDYTPCHFYYFKKIFSCKKIILGDISQAIEKRLKCGYINELAKMFDNIQTMELNICYRSTRQIGEFAQKIYGKKLFNCVNRNGKNVELIVKNDELNALSYLKNICKKWLQGDYNRCAIIVKNKKQAIELYERLGDMEDIKLMEKNESAKVQIVTTVASKGLEFDGVMVYNSNEENFNSELDRNLLYISATRALHELYFVATKKLSPFLIIND